MEKHDTSEHSRQLPQTLDFPQDFTTERTLVEKSSDQPVSNEPVAPSEDDYEYLSGLKLVLVVGTVTLVALLMLLDSSIIVTAIPKITSEFHSIPDVGWYASAYLLGNCALQPLSGKLYTHFSSKYTFITFLGVFELGSLLCGVAPSSNMLIVGRAVAGMGGSGLTNGALTIISASVPLKKRPALLGMIMSIAQLGILFGPLIGGALTQFTTWRWCFYINLPAGAAMAALLLSIRIPDRVVKEDKDAPFKQTLRKLDLLGSALFASMIIMFLLALQWGGTLYPWKSATVIGLFLGSCGVLCIFIAWERHQGSRAMIPLSMLRKRVVYSSCLTMFFTLGSVIILTYYLPIWFQTVKGATPTLSGVYLLPMILSQMAFAIGSGILGKLAALLTQNCMNR
jgi:MFS family permease